MNKMQMMFCRIKKEERTLTLSIYGSFIPPLLSYSPFKEKTKKVKTNREK